MKQKNKAGFLCTVQSGKKDAHRAVEEAKCILTAVERKELKKKTEDIFGDSLPLHEHGEMGCTFLPVNLSKDDAPLFPVVTEAVEAIENFCSDPLPPAGTPEYLARLVPVERTCPARIEVCVVSVRARVCATIDFVYTMVSSESTAFQTVV